MSTSSRRDDPFTSDLKSAPHFDDCVRLAVAAGSPTLSPGKDRNAYDEAKEIFEQTGKLDAALERISVPIVPGGYQRRELFRPVLQLAVLSFLIVLFLVFAGTTWIPDIAKYYDEVNQPKPALIGWLLWFQTTASKFSVLIEIVFLVMLLMLVLRSRFDIPSWLPGVRSYRQACDRFQEARYRKIIDPQKPWPVIERVARSQVVSIASMWRQSLPLVLGMVVGGSLVLVYSLALFVPIVQLIMDLSLPNVMNGRPG